MRRLRLALAFLAALACGTAPAAGCGPGLRVQVLGSGGPEPTGRRAGSGYLVWVDGRARVLVDAGSGTSLRFGASGARFEDLDLVAVTHYHTDHVAELPSLLKGGYFTDRTRPLVLAGPDGAGEFPSLEAFAKAMFGPGEGAFGYLGGYLDGSDGLALLERRTVDPASRDPVPIYDADGVRVTAMGVTHGPVPALAYRLEYDGRRIVFSGDQNGDDVQFAEFARGASLLIMAHAVPQDAGPVAARLHALPSEIGEIAQAAGVRHLVLSHLMRRSERALEQSLDIVAAHYRGPVTVAQDLMCLAP